MFFSRKTTNRLGFIILGLTNNFAYVIMLSAAYDLLKKSSSDQPTTKTESSVVNGTNIIYMDLADPKKQPYCNAHSTSTILLADTLPSLATKIIYPFLFVRIPIAYKAAAVALFSSASFWITGFSYGNLPLIFIGVICASLSSGLGESTYLSNTTLYGDAALSGWSIGTGAAGILGAGIYALLASFLETESIMLVMHLAPIAMILAFFCVVKPTTSESSGNNNNNSGHLDETIISDDEPTPSEAQSNEDILHQPIGQQQVKSYGASGVNNETTTTTTATTAATNITNDGGNLVIFEPNRSAAPNGDGPAFDFEAKLQLLPSLVKYFGPLLLVYFAEYFINQGLFELIYYPKAAGLSKAEQYRWFQMTYQVGVMISRSTLDLFRIKYLWAMALLQAANAILFLAHSAQVIYIPNFYIVELLIVYEGLLGGFTYVNAFYRIKKEVEPDKHEFCISTVTMADSMGIVMAGLVALPVHDALCKLYSPISID